MSAVTVRYPGRACLLGEHCDWAGGSSLTVPLPMGIDVKGEVARADITVHSALDGELLEGRWEIDKPNVNRGPLRFVGAAINVLNDAGFDLCPTELWVQSDLPEGRGFSSSAAFTLGILDALTRLANQPVAAEQLVEMAYRVEHDQLGIACGRLDPAACAAGQPLFLRWIAHSNDHIEMKPQRIQPLGVLHLVVAAFERPRNTPQILQTLHDHFKSPVLNADGDAVREAIATFAENAEQGAYAMQNGDTVGLGTAMNTAQHAYEEHLARRFSSTRAPRLVQVCRDLRQEGALGAKFSGAGGDGSVVALFENENAARAAAIRLEETDMFSWYVPVEAP
jgi:mevalonate kinase